MTNTEYILAIESSCDDTAVAVLREKNVISSVISSQLIHKKYEGIIPEIASRKHQENILPVLKEALKQANVSLNEIDIISATQGPGLLGSLLVGFTFAKGLAIALKKPFVGVSHLQGHLLSPMLENENLNYPYLVLLVSGGHTLLSIVHSSTKYEHIGGTLDDAAGEAFDKGAVLLNLGYPGGPAIDKIAKIGNENKYKFPITKLKDFKFSFSGLKTSLLYFLQKNIAKNPNFIEENLPDIAASYQKTIIEQLLFQLRKALEKYNIKNVALAGGVSANSYLRKRFLLKAQELKVNPFLVPLKYCTDNAAMIGLVAYEKAKQGIFTDLTENPYPREFISL